MKRYRCFLSAMLFTSPVKKVLYAVYCIAMAGILLFLQPVQTILWRDCSQSTLIQLRVLLFLLSAVVCAAAEYSWIKTNAYRYLSTLPMPRGLRLVSLLHRMTVMVLVCVLVTVLLGNAHGLYAILQALYTALLLVAASALLTHIVYTVLKHTAKRKYKYLPWLLLGLPAAVLIYYALHWDIDTYKMLYHTLIRAVDRYCLTPNTAAAVLSIGWLLILRQSDLHYRPFGPLIVPKKYNGSNAVFHGVLQNVLYKDFSLAKTKPSYVILSLLCLLIGIFSARYRFNESVNTVIALILCLISSTLSEELMKHDIDAKPLLKTLPVRLTAFYRAKIASVCLVLTSPVILFLFVTLIRSTYTFLTFILAVLAAAVVGCAFCAMQCAIVFHYADHVERLQFVLLFSVFLSLFLPIFPLIYLACMGRKSRRSFCEGRE